MMEKRFYLGGIPGEMDEMDPPGWWEFLAISPVRNCEGQRKVKSKRYAKYQIG
jgi:hypothetical protein